METFQLLTRDLSHPSSSVRTRDCKGAKFNQLTMQDILRNLRNAFWGDSLKLFEG